MNMTHRTASIVLAAAFWKLYGMELTDGALEKLNYRNALKLVNGLPTAGFPPFP